MSFTSPPTKETVLPILRLVPHNGTFHCDDAFAYATPRTSLQGVDHHLTRTRDPAQIASADSVWDVDALHNASAGRFDHHPRGAPVRGDIGIPLSAAGLVWQVHGAAAVGALLTQTDAARAEAVAAAIDDEVIRRIDAVDNCIEHPEDTLGTLGWVGPKRNITTEQNNFAIAEANLFSGLIYDRR